MPDLAAKRSTARRWIHAEATVISLANILTMPGNCKVHKRRNRPISMSSRTFRQLQSANEWQQQYLREPVLASEHGAQGVGGPRQVEQVGVEEA